MLIDVVTIDEQFENQLRDLSLAKKKMAMCVYERSVEATYSIRSCLLISGKNYVSVLFIV